MVKWNVDQWSIWSAEGSDVKGMALAAHSRHMTNERKGTLKEPSGNHSGWDYNTKDEVTKRTQKNLVGIGKGMYKKPTRMSQRKP